MNRFERRKLAIDKSIREQIEQYKGIYAEADAEDRDPTDDERLEIESHLKAIETLKAEKEDVEQNIKTLQHVDDVGRELGPAVSVVPGGEPHDRMFQMIDSAMPIPAGYGSWGSKSIGEVFVDSKGYKSAVQAYKEAGRLPSGYSTGMIEMKGTLGEAASTGIGAAIGGGGLIPVPQVIPGTVQKLFQPLVFADLILDGQTTSNSLRLVTEGTATSGAAGVVEGAAKPESTVGITTSDEPVKKIATLLPISEEMLEDAPAVQAYVNGRLVLFVRIEEERQLLRGSSGGAEVQGMLTSRGVPVYAGGTAAGSKAEQLFKAMNGMRGSAFVEPEWAVVHPSDWEQIRLLKDSSGQYYGGGPFLGAYGGPQGPIGNSGQVSGPQDTIWNKPVYITGTIGAGTALVGSRANAQVWRRGGVSVEATNSHSTYFALNLIAIRAEERLGLAVYRPAGYVEVRLS